MMPRAGLAVLFFAFALPAFGFEEPFHLINTGSGAPALGMGGAFVAVAQDLSGIYWNPAGLSQLKSLHLRLEYETMRSQEDFAFSSFFIQPASEHLSLSGNHPSSVAISWCIDSGKVQIVPVFAWQRISPSFSTRTLDAPVQTMSRGPTFLDLTVLQDYRHDFSGTESQYSFGAGVKFSRWIAVGAVWNLIRGKVTENFDDRSDFTRTDFDGQPFSSQLILRRTIQEEPRGNSLQAGVLVWPGRSISLGGTIRFPYTRTSSVLEVQEGSFDGVPFQITQNRVTEVSLPTEWNLGASIFLSGDMLLASSITYADWSKTFQDTDDNRGSPFPTMLYYVVQSSLFQWRTGLEYRFRNQQEMALRAGFFLDDQPYTNSTWRLSEPIDDTAFWGFAFGGGFYGLNVAFVHEWGNATTFVRNGGITDGDLVRSDGRLTFNRLVFSYEFKRF